jgi:DNA uptake protein ComE-like DNA-binding protein
VDVKDPMRASGLMRAWTLALAVCIGTAQAATPSAAPTPSSSAASTGRKAHPPAAKQPAPIDINSANRDQLKTLPGIGDVEADRIISGRPYHSKADLAERGVIPTGVYVSLKGRIIAKQKAKGKVGVP